MSSEETHEILRDGPKLFSPEEVEKLNEKFQLVLSELTRADVINSFGELRIVTEEEQKHPFELGQQTVENTAFSVKQFVATLCTIEKDLTAYMQVLEKERFEGVPDSMDKILNLEQAIKDQILRGLKILDLGCGQRPFFSYVARMLGAEVYTADVIPAKSFEPFERGEIVDERAEKFHIQYDLDKEDALSVIEEKSGGQFNFITEAHLDTGTPRVVEGKHMDAASRKGRSLAKGLLIPQGIYYNAEFKKLQHTSRL